MAQKYQMKTKKAYVIMNLRLVGKIFMNVRGTP
jgi:hypothetical protein